MFDTRTITVQETISKSSIKKGKRTKLLQGHKIVLQTYSLLGEMTLSYSSISHLNKVGPPPDLLEIYELLMIIQKTFPNIFITSNRAEQFNSVHDRSVSYRGRKTLEKANNRLKSWILFKYYQSGLKYYLVRNSIKIPIFVLQKSYHLQFNSIKFK